jgi:penicillin-binding protein 1B
LRIRFNRGFWTSRFGLTLLAGALLVFLAAAGALTFYYVKFAHLIDQRLTGQVFQNTSRVFSAPGRISEGETLRSRELQGYLERAGYTPSQIEGAPGWFRTKGAVVEIHPSSNSYFRGGNALRIEFSGTQVARIQPLAGGETLASAELEPELLTNLFDSSREKRRVVRFADLPRPQVDAVLAAEDKRFFEHPGFDPLRILGAAWADLRVGAKAQGASTITMQVARTFFFSPQRRWRRKLAETLMALELEQRFSKQEIFELYANQVYLGNRGSFAIRGFGEAAQTYFGKDVRELTLGENAFLAGIIRAPNHYSTAERHPERAIEARDRVLNSMVEDKLISPAAADEAKRGKLRITGGISSSSGAPYFVDMVKDSLLDRFSEADLVSQSYRIYTTLDPSLQRAATEAVGIGMKNADTQLARRYAAWRKRGEAVPAAQAALVALDPRTGEIKALVGGRDYGQSQLNHALARRQPGSAFKPFVYAAAFSNVVDGMQPVITPLTTVVDEPTTFEFDGKEYTPNNYGEQFYGTVTLREALMRSLNVATVKVAEMVGYNRVAAVARQMGLDPHIQPTPAMALGAYEMTPLEVAAGYTAFAGGGIRAEPVFLRSVVSADGASLERYAPRTRPVLDPRVAFLATSLLEDVLNHGTAAGVRAHGFTAPAAGKTGTSHDGWFAGYTSNLVCVIWVGFDDNRELGLSGAGSALPIWAEFMKRAIGLPGYRSPQTFDPPAGVVKVTIDPDTLQLATTTCPTTRDEFFIAGTEPTEYCTKHGGRALAQPAGNSWLSRLFGSKKPSAPPPAPVTGSEKPSAVSNTTVPKAEAQPTAAAMPPNPPGAEGGQKKGLLQRIFGIFGAKKKEPDKPSRNP